MMSKIIRLCLSFIIIKEWQINGQAIIGDQCQNQASTMNDLLMKIRQLEIDYKTVAHKQKNLEDELQQMKDNGKFLF